MRSKNPQNLRNNTCYGRTVMTPGMRIALLLLAAGTLAGCGGNASDLEEYVKSLKQSTVQPSWKPDSPTPVSYQSARLRSPFETTQAVTKEGRANPLQAYPVTMLRFAGTVSGTNETMAYVLTPDNMVWQVRVGDRIGDHAGKIIAIDQGQITVMEMDQEAGKAPTGRKVTLQLRDER